MQTSTMRHGVSPGAEDTAAARMSFRMVGKAR